MARLFLNESTPPPCEPGDQQNEHGQHRDRYASRARLGPNRRRSWTRAALRLLVGHSFRLLVRCSAAGTSTRRARLNRVTNILLTGARGQLGTRVETLATSAGHTVTAVGSDELDIHRQPRG